MWADRVGATTADDFVHEGIRFRSAGSVSPTFSVVHTHGMAGGAVENPWVWDLARAVTKLGGEFLATGNRGRGLVSDLATIDGDRLAGATFERFAHSLVDLDAWVAQAQTDKVILSGHSLGVPKSVAWLVDRKPENVVALLALAPADMVGITHGDPAYAALRDEARGAMAKNEPTRMLSNPYAEWAIISAGTWTDYSTSGHGADTVNATSPDPTLGLVSRVEVPMLFVMGSEDTALARRATEGIANLAAQRGNRADDQVEILDGAGHQFEGAVAQMAKVSADFIARCLRAQ